MSDAPAPALEAAPEAASEAAPKAALEAALEAAPEAPPTLDIDGAPLPDGVLRVRLGPGANCSSAGSAIDVLFYGSVIVGALAVALAAAFPPREPDEADADPAASDDT